MNKQLLLKINHLALKISLEIGNWKLKIVARKHKTIFFCLIILAFIVFLSQPLTTHAICPVCVVAVGAGVGFSRWLGIDDTITGIWIGGLTLSIILWNIDWFRRKNIKFPARNILTFLAYYILILVSLRWSNFIGHPINKLWGFDKILLGMTIGTIFFALGNFYYTYLKNKNNGHSYFPFQKVVMPVTSLIIISLVFYIITK